MDNLTHSLFGFAVADTIVAVREEQDPPSWRKSIYWGSILANNIPDLDFLYARITEGRLGYLLHHRGHTHTLLAAVPLAVFLLGLFSWFHRKEKLGWSKEQWMVLAFVVGIGPWLHILLDSLNSYGVHPFWPLDNGWKYGDAVFIIEPALWLGILPLAFLSSAGSKLRYLMALIYLGALGLVWGSGYVPRETAAIITVISLTLTFALAKLVPLKRAVATLGIIVLVIGVFDVSSRMARASFLRYHAGHFPKATLIDAILSPLPANPFCWTIVTVEVERENLVSRRGIFSSWPEHVKAADCPKYRDGGGTADYGPVGLNYPEASMQWFGQTSAPLSVFRQLARENCQFAAFLKFARAPFIKPYEEEKTGAYLVGDIRFDWENGPGFSKMKISSAEEKQCPKFIPPWTPPLQVLLQ